MANTKELQPTMEDLLKHVADQKAIIIGDKITGKIINIAKNEVILDIENVGLGMVRGKELYNDEYLSLLKIGEIIDAVIIDLDNEMGMIELSFRAIGRDKIWSEITKRFEEKKVVEAKIRDVNRGGFLVKVQGVYGFLPASLLSPAHAIKQIGMESKNLVNQMKKYIGQVFNVKIISLNDVEDTVIVSEKSVADEIANLKLAKYKVGDSIDGTIVGIVDFGLFVRFDEELEGLIHISEIAWKKVESISKEYKIGDKVKAKIIEIDKDNRINLSIKQTLENPWVSFAKKTKVGDKFSGKVSKIVGYGVIITNNDDIQGLCHISQISEKNLESPAEIHELLKVGEIKEFTVISVDLNEKLYLTLLDLKTALAREEENKKIKEIEQQNEGELIKKEEDTKIGE